MVDDLQDVHGCPLPWLTCSFLMASNRAHKSLHWLDSRRVAGLAGGIVRVLGMKFRRNPPICQDSFRRKLSKKNASIWRHFFWDVMGSRLLEAELRSRAGEGLDDDGVVVKGPDDQGQPDN